MHSFSDNDKRRFIADAREFCDALLIEIHNEIKKELDRFNNGSGTSLSSESGIHAMLENRKHIKTIVMQLETELASSKSTSL